MANRANIERIQKDLYPITCADIRRHLEDQVLGFKLHDLDVRRWMSPNGRASYSVIRISMFGKDICPKKKNDNYVDRVLAENSIFHEYDEDVVEALKPFMFPKHLIEAKQSVEVLAKLWERGIDNSNIDNIIRFSSINPVKELDLHICYLMPEKIMQHMLEDPTTGKIDGTFSIPYSNVFGKDEKDFIWYPMIDREGTSQQPVSLDTLYNL